MKKVRTIFTIVYLLISVNAVAQNEDRTVYFVVYSASFEEHKADLTNEGKVTIDTICQRIIARGIDSFFEKKEIVLQSYTTTKEREENNLIGMMRCVAILDYIEDRFKIPRSKFLIRDRVPNPYAKPEVVFAFFRKLQ